MATQKGRNWSSGDIVTAANLSSIERGVSAVAEEYTPTTWANGNTVTAAALNNIEQGIANASGSETWVTLTEESVTTIVEEGEPAAYNSLAYSELITADTIKVIFNGTKYTCNKITNNNRTYYGGVGEQGPDFSEYPFVVVSGTAPSGSYNNFVTESAGTYSIKIEVPQENGSSDFSTATVTVVNGGMITLPVTQEADPSHEAPAYLMVVGQALEAGTYSVPLYKGGLMIDLPIGATVSGNIQETGMGYLITGDCTITISDSSSGPIK